MKVIVENLGAVKKAEIDLSKGLLIFTGENNSGKTYLAYAVYAIYTKTILRLPIENMEVEKLSPEQIFLKYKKELEIAFSELTRGKLASFFAVNSNFFDNSDINIEFQKEETPLQYLRRFEHLATFRKRFDCENIIIFPSMREGIVLFNKELSIIKNKTFDKILEDEENEYNDGDKEMWLSLKKRFNRYPQPVKDSLEFAQNLDVYKQEKSEFAYLADELEDTFLDGKIKIGDDGDVNFKMNGSREAFEIHTASSTVKSLSYLSVYLRHIAKKGDFIIIDEPELNLHPDNQRKLARFFGRLINEDFKLLISTHSDYIVRELNNLIMLKEGINNKPKETKALLKKHDYEKTQLIDKEQVGVYLFRKGKEVENIKVEETGFSVPTIDEEIAKLNQTTSDILNTVFD